MNKIILLLTIVSLPGSVLFTSNNRPIYTIKDNTIHKSSGQNQSECTKYKPIGITSDNRGIYEDSKCKEHKIRINIQEIRT